jgi:3-hydroxybutyryl-CoA dehydrogenase
MALETITCVGVVGAGTMGSGIAQVAAEAGFSVVMRDVTDQLVKRGLDAIRSNLERRVKKGKLTPQQAEEVMGRIRGTTDLDEMAGVQWVFEAVVEDMAVKKEVFRHLDRLCAPEVVFASNTSGLSITEMAAVTGRPDKVVGMHFFNPVPVMKLVEVVKGVETSEETVRRARDMAVRLDKEPIEVKDAPLFVVNRILVPMINEAVFLLMEGVVTPEDIDRAMKLGANHPIGPLALADLVGLDVVLAVCDTLHRETGDPKYRPCPLLRQMVRSGRLGRKSGKGFYDYTVQEGAVHS